MGFPAPSFLYVCCGIEQTGGIGRQAGYVGHAVSRPPLSPPMISE